MKHLYRTVCAVLACAVLSGCSWMDGSYVSVTPHQIGYYQTDDDLFVVSNFSQLRNALTGLIDSGAEDALITLVDYPRDQVLDDMKSAVTYASSVYPLGAYAVDSIDYEHGNSGGKEIISVDVRYRRSKTEIDQIHSVRGIDGASEAIADALATCQPTLVLQISGYVDTDFVQLIEDYSNLHPETVMEVPKVTVQDYPDGGSVRILELQFSYQTSREALRFMRSKVAPVFASAALYVSRDSGDEVQLSQLCNFLMQRFQYTVQPSITPAYSLLGYGIGDSRAFANVYGAMCRQVGLEAVTVSGTCNGESRCWNIVRCGDVYYHVDLLRSRQVQHLQLFSDRDMSQYVWDYSAYPPCGVQVPEAPPVPTSTESSQTVPSEPAELPPETTVPPTVPPTGEPHPTEPTSAPTETPSAPTGAGS